MESTPSLLNPPKPPIFRANWGNNSERHLAGLSQKFTCEEKKKLHVTFLDEASSYSVTNVYIRAASIYEMRSI